MEPVRARRDPTFALYFAVFSGKNIKIFFDKPLSRVAAHERVTDDAGSVAIERGPLVYCFEGIDHADKVFNLTIPDNAKLYFRVVNL